jgi:putative selenium metabolism protein SsnA
MSTAVIRGTVFTLGESARVIEDGAVLYDGDTIVAVGSTEEIQGRADETLDAGGRVVMPGLICAHHHLYSTFACGIAAEPANDFVAQLESLWWKIDRALGLEDVHISALVALMRCIRAGTTTIIDHHASPHAIRGSLTRIGDATERAGLRASLCYEVTDRNGPDGARAGIEENEAWLERCADSCGMRHGLVGVHAAMTVGHDTLAACVDAARRHGSGLHIHVAEDRADQDHSLSKYGKRVLARLADAGGLGENTMAIHCVHVDGDEIHLLADSGTTVVHNPQSNANNGVGCARVPELLARGVRVGLGSDGMTANMLDEARAALFVRHHATGNPSTGWPETAAMLLANNPAITTRFFGRKLGVLEPGAAADIIITDYRPFTPVTAENTLGHILFGVAAESVCSTICAGRLLMQDQELKTLDPAEIIAEARARAPAVWQRFATL